MYNVEDFLKEQFDLKELPRYVIPVLEQEHVLDIADPEECIEWIRNDPKLLDLVYGKLLNASQAKAYAEQHVTRTSARSPMRRLEKIGLQPTFVLMKGRRRFAFYQQSVLNRVILLCNARESVKREQFEGKLRTPEAIRELEKLMRVRKGSIKPDTFYHMIKRHSEKSTSDPHHITVYRDDEDGIITCYFTLEDIKKLVPSRPLKRPKNFKPSPVRGSYDFKRLENKYGPLLTEEGMLEAMSQKAGYQYSMSTLKQRIARGDIWAVGVTKGGAEWYAKMQLDYLTFVPSIGKTRKSRAKEPVDKESDVFDIETFDIVS